MNAIVEQRPVAHLLNRGFDVSLVLAPALLGLLALAVVTHNPGLFVLILLADLWLLGYHHVIATYLRLGLDASTRTRHMSLWLLLPAMLAVVGLAAWLVGVWLVATVYFFWQWFHYVRQSWGIALVLRGNSGAAAKLDRFDQSVFWLVPLAGILWRSAEQHAQFLGAELWTPAIPKPAALVVVTVAALATLMWLRRCWQRRKTETHLGTVFIATHLAMFAVGYIATSNIDHGWLAINIWHNLQYLLFVYAFNRRRYRQGVEHESRILSWVSQPNRAIAYFLLSGALTLAIYEIGLYFAFSLSEIGIAGLVVVFQAINFHHYVADSKIWKLREPSLASTLKAGS